MLQRLNLECPTGSHPLVELGEKLGNDFVVIEVQANKVVLGPLKAGNLEVTLPCSNGEFLKSQWSVKAAEDAQQELGKILGLWQIATPWWVIVTGSILLFFLISLGFYLWRKKYLARQQQVEVKTTKAKPRERLESFAKSLAHESHPQTLKEQLHLVVRTVKDFMIEKLDLDPETLESSTQSEWLGHIKVGFQQARLYDATLVQALESFFHEAEIYRFSQRAPDIQHRDRTLSLIQALLKLGSQEGPRAK